MPVNLEKSGPVPTAQEYFDLGCHGRLIATSTAEAQIWFDRGLNWVYGFNHREAAGCFHQVTQHDPSCVMGYWGEAYARGPNYNKVWSAFDKNDLNVTLRDCYKLSQEAKKRADPVKPVEYALVHAITRRFPSPDVPTDFTPSVVAYADAMREVYHQFGDDLDVIALAADAIMSVAPWGLYDSQTGEPNLDTPVLEIEEIMARAIKHPRAKKHPGILHMYIHLVEMSQTPEMAILPMEYLRELVPDAGHLHHMPSHIDVLIGDWRRAITTNYKAIRADDKYVAREGTNNFYSFYRFHNSASLIFAAMMSGWSQMALDECTHMESTITENLLRQDSPPMADWLETFLSIRVHIYIRFGMWEELQKMAVPKNQELYCVTVAFTHYGKAIAWAATGQVKMAETEKALFLAAASRVPPTRVDFPNKVVDILEVAKAMVDGEIDYRRGDYEKAYESLRLAIERDDNLLYSEPWGWMLPTRHPYAALLLEQGHVEEAAKIYEQDLGIDSSVIRAHQHRGNVWALHGYHECLLRLGRNDEAKKWEPQLTTALASADVSIKSSCFCRLEAVGTDCASECSKLELQ